MQHDVVVLGSGAAGLMAALSACQRGADVAVLERGDHVGGSTGMSGGVIWVPANPHARAAGIEDNREDALTYLRSVTVGRVDHKMLEVFVDTGAEMVEWIEASTPLRLGLIPRYPDYHPSHPGHREGGRGLEPQAFPFDTLGEWADKVTGPVRPSRVSFAELGLGVTPEVAQERRLHDARARGPALVGGLLRACLDRGIIPRLNTRATDLLIEDGRVRGVRIEVDGRSSDVTATRGIVLATGGFDWAPEMITAYLRGPMDAPVGVVTNTGDGQLMAMRAGAAMSNMQEAWWCPMVEIASDGATPVDGVEFAVRLPGFYRFLCQRERSLPRSIVVNRSGLRFGNEATNYSSYGALMHRMDAGSLQYENLPCYLIFDAEYYASYGLLGNPPGSTPPTWVTSANTLGELAAKLDIDQSALLETVERWNEEIQQGIDPRFGKGNTAHDQYYGDPTKQGPARCLGPLTTAPFYGVEMKIGSLGTKGGALTNADSAVLDLTGQPVPGLFAAGNAMSSVLAAAYGGPGGTLGPAMIFGFIAGRSAALS